MAQASRNSDPEAPVRAAKEFLRAILLEDGIGAAADAASNPTLLPGLDPITRHLLVVELLEANLYERLKEPDPFDEDTGDPYWAPLPYGGAPLGGLNPAIAPDPDCHGSGDTRGVTAQGSDAACADGSKRFEETRPGVLQAGRFEQATVSAHRVMQTSGAIRTLAAARYATYAPPAGTPEHAPSDLVDHGPGHAYSWADSFLGPALGIGPYQAERLVGEASWMHHRTPRLLDQVAHQGPQSHHDVLGVFSDGVGSDQVGCDEAALRRSAAGNQSTRRGTPDAPTNLDTIAAIARELQDARPETCETVEAAVLRRGIHHTTRREPQRSTRTLVTRHEATAARTTAKKSKTQQENVWIDPYPTPGLSLLTIITDSERAAALYSAVDEQAHRLHGAVDDGRTLGQHRTDAVFAMAMQGVTLNVNLDIIVPNGAAGGGTGSGSRSSDSGTGDNGGGNRCGHPPPAEEPEENPTNSTNSGLPERCHQPARQSPVLSPMTPPLSASAVPAVFRAAPPRLHTAMRNPSSLAFHHTGVVALNGLSQLLANLPAVRLKTRVRTVADLSGRGTGWSAPKAPAGPATGAGSSPTGGSSYRPGESLRAEVRARDRTCRFPGCTLPARHTDLDHIIPWPRGETALSNLHCLCRRHHRAKQSGWRVDIGIDADGRNTNDSIETWTSPSGRSYLSVPGLLQDLTDAGVADTS